MIHKYRKTALIEAEQFDESDEMINKYQLRKYNHCFSLPLGFEPIHKGDYIITDEEGEVHVLDADYFEYIYERAD